MKKNDLRNFKTGKSISQVQDDPTPQKKPKFPSDFFSHQKPSVGAGIRMKQKGHPTRNRGRYNDSAERESRGSFQDSSPLGENKRYHSNDRNEKHTNVYLNPVQPPANLGSTLHQGAHNNYSRGSMRSNSTVTNTTNNIMPTQIYSSAFEELNRFQQNC